MAHPDYFLECPGDDDGNPCQQCRERKELVAAIVAYENRHAPEQGSHREALLAVAEAATWLSEVDAAYCFISPGIYGLDQLYDDDEITQARRQVIHNREDCARCLAAERSRAWARLDAALNALCPTFEVEECGA
ncbi:MAG: hypothetical protein HY794_16705 [Desulfarculus sp.]|nr:hypothetical protein [Desulfarculus sp.]